MFFAPGPYKIVDNYIGGIPTENIFSGGLPVLVANAIPSDIEIRTNTLVADYQNKSNSRSRKNFIEFKGSQRLLIDGNTLEYSWNANTGSAQYGSAFVLNTLAQGAPATWLTNQDTTFTNNDVQHFGNGFLILPGRTGFSNPTYPLNTRTLLSNNVYRDWNQQTYNLNFGGNNSAGFNTLPGYGDASHPASGPDYTTITHNGFYGSPSNADNFSNLGNFFTGGCPGSVS